MHLRKVMTVKELTLKAPFEVSYLVPNSIKPYRTPLQRLFFPAAVEMVKTIYR